MAVQKTVLITGCSAGGIGAALALSLAKRGHRVFATARDPSKIPAELASLSVVHTLALDVTSAASVRAAAEAVGAITEETLGTKGLDVLVNNAGVGYVRPLLDVDVARAQQLFDTNLWGGLRVIQAFSDLLIARRGRIVNVSSVGAFVNTPWIGRGINLLFLSFLSFLCVVYQTHQSPFFSLIGVYSASKAAINALSDTLRAELTPFGVGVVTLMVGTVQTPFYAQQTDFDLPEGSRYAPARAEMVRWGTGAAVTNACSVDAFAESVVDDIVGPAAGRHVWKGPNSSLIWFLSSFVPGWLVVSLSFPFLSFLSLRTVVLVPLPHAGFVGLVD